MEKIKIEICTGTACFVMGSPELLKVTDLLPPKIKSVCEITPILCCNLCRDWENVKPPIAKVNGKIIGATTLTALKEKVMNAFEDNKNAAQK